MVKVRFTIEFCINGHLIQCLLSVRLCLLSVLGFGALLGRKGSCSLAPECEPGRTDHKQDSHTLIR